MKLQFKLALYNALTKAAIIGVLGIFILVFIKNISVDHIRLRLKEKRTKLIEQLSEPEIHNFLSKQGNYTDYNLLKEEYFTLNEVQKITIPKVRFSEEMRSIDGNELDYQILTQDFAYKGKRYRLELGETMEAVKQIEHTVLRFTLLVLVVAALITLITDLIFAGYLLAPFYRIIDEKINLVNDPAHFNYVPVKTSTADFKLLDESISMLMNKFNAYMRTQKEFIANVSHELLTPITILSARHENLLNEEQLSPEGENKIFANMKTLNRLKAIINSLLLISKIEHRQYAKKDIIPVKQAVLEVCEELEHRLLMQGLHMELALTGDFELEGNASLFHVMLTNLVNNAIKYNTAQGKIRITLTSNAESFKLQVVDTGRGMDAAALEKIFVRYEKLRPEDENSNGLGLSIVKHIADFHEIKIHIASAEGEGTTVTLSFGPGEQL